MLLAQQTYVGIWLARFKNENFEPGQTGLEISMQW
jgi:hypothetical protein